MTLKDRLSHYYSFFFLLLNSVISTFDEKVDFSLGHRSGSSSTSNSVTMKHSCGRHFLTGYSVIRKLLYSRVEFRQETVC